jgi:hypothetical protein
MTLGSFAVLIALGLAFWLLGERARRHGRLGPELAEPTLADDATG